MSAAAVGTPRTLGRARPTLGIVAVVIATQSVTTLVRFPELLLVSLFHASEAVDFLVLFLLTTGAGLVAVVLGLVAAIRGRGRWWGIAAVLIAILGNIWFLELVRALVRPTG